MDRAPDRSGEAARLAAIRNRIGALSGARWLLSATDEAMQIDARGLDGSLVTVATFTRLATQDEMEIAAGAPDDLRFLLGLVDRAIAALRRAAGDDGRRRRNDRNHAAEAAMLCQSAAFKRWLIDRHGLENPASDERAAARLRGLLGVSSRREINEDEAVRARWIALRGEFRAWRAAG